MGWINTEFSTAIDDCEMLAELPRIYLGGSILGEECTRKLWYGFHHYPKKPFPRRIKRIFDLGHSIEKLVVEVLRTAATVIDLDPETGRQFEVRFRGGHVRGHTDGVIKSDYLSNQCDPYLLEIKSMKNAQFNWLKSKGVEISHTKYADQMQVYMHGSDQFMADQKRLEQACFVAYNKDTSELHIEEIEYNADEAKRLVQKADDIVHMSDIPVRPYNGPQWWACKMCDFREVCWQDKPVTPTSCRQCKWCFPVEQGGWICNNDSSPAFGRENPNLCRVFEGIEGHTYEDMK